MNNKDRTKLYVEPRFKFEQPPDEPEAFKTIQQVTNVWDGKQYVKIGVRYSTAATQKLSEDIQENIMSLKPVKKK